MAELVDNSVTLPVHALTNGAIFEAGRTQSTARGSKRGYRRKARSRTLPAFIHS